MKTYLYLYGIGRNLKQTQNLIDFFKKNHPELCIKYFLLKVEKINNVRSKENGFIDYQFLNNISGNLSYVRINHKKKSDLFDYSKTLKDCHNDDYKSYSNLINQLMILEDISRDISNLNKLSDSERFIIIRDDIKLSTLSVLFYRMFYKNSGILKKKVLISAYSWHGGINDKFFIAGRETSLTLASRINYLREYSKQKEHLNAEELLLYTIRKSNIKLNPIFVRVGRVRINNRITWDNWYPSVTRIKDFVKVIKNLVD